MRNRVLLVFLAIALVVSLVAFAACAKEEEAPPVEEEAPPVEEEAPPVEEEAPPVEEVWQWPEKLSIANMSTTSAGYAAAVGWTTPLGEDTGMKIRMVCIESTIESLMMLREGLFFLSSPHQSLSMLYAEPAIATRDGGPFQSRITYPACKTCFGFGARGDSGIKTPYDIKPGMKIMILTFSQEPRKITEALLAWGQIDPEDVEWVPAGSLAATFRAIIDGKADLTLGYIETPGWYEVEASPHGCGWIELDAKKDPEGAKRFLEAYSFTGFGIGSGGVPSAEGIPMCLGVSPYITRAETDPELVYHWVKWMDESYDRFKDAHPWSKSMTIDNLMFLAETHYEPLHDGTVRYLEEKGLWTEAHEARRQQNIELMTRWVEAYQTAIDMADDKGIQVNPDSEEWIELWENYKKQLPLFSFFVGLD